MIVYVVNAGAYADNRVVAVFSSAELAAGWLTSLGFVRRQADHTWRAWWRNDNPNPPWDGVADVEAFGLDVEVTQTARRF